MTESVTSIMATPRLAEHEVGGWIMYSSTREYTNWQPMRLDPGLSCKMRL